MHNHISTITKDSIVHAGVRFSFRVISEGMRRRLRRELASSFERIGQIEMERSELVDQIAQRLGLPVGEVKFSQVSGREGQQLRHIDERIDIEKDTVIDAAYLREAFCGVENLTVDGRAIESLEDLVEHGSPAFLAEITRAIRREAGLDPEEEANLGSPSTSTGAVDGRTNVTGAVPANAPDGTSSVTAAKSPAE